MLPTICVTFRELLTSRSIPKRDGVWEREGETIFKFVILRAGTFCPNRASLREGVPNACDHVKERRFQRRAKRLL